MALTLPIHVSVLSTFSIPITCHHVVPVQWSGRGSGHAAAGLSLLRRSGSLDGCQETGDSGRWRCAQIPAAACAGVTPLFILFLLLCIHGCKRETAEVECSILLFCAYTSPHLRRKCTFISSAFICRPWLHSEFTFQMHEIWSAFEIWSDKTLHPIWEGISLTWLKH